MLYKHQYQFSKRVEMIDITYQIKKDLKESNIKNGIIVVYTPHTIFGASQTLITSEGKIILGIWQSVYLCEFDGPRNRTYYVKIIEG